MKLITTKRYKELLADSNENVAREVTITNLAEEIRKLKHDLRKKDEYIAKLKESLEKKPKSAR